MAENVSDPGKDLPVAGVQDAPEKVLTQSEVDKLVGRVRKEVSTSSYEKGLNEGKSYSQQTMGGMQQMNPADIEAMIQRALPQHIANHSQQLQANNMANEFISRIGAAKSKYPDLDERLNRYDMGKIGHIMALATKFDNTADIMDDLDNNPKKIIDLVNTHALAPHKTIEEMRKLSVSIKNNEDASKRQKSSEPLSQLNASPVGAGDGSMDDSLEAFKNADWLRG